MGFPLSSTPKYYLKQFQEVTVLETNNIKGSTAAGRTSLAEQLMNFKFNFNNLTRLTLGSRVNY